MEDLCTVFVFRSLVEWLQTLLSTRGTFWLSVRDRHRLVHARPKWNGGCARALFPLPISPVPQHERAGSASPRRSASRLLRFFVLCAYRFSAPFATSTELYEPVTRT